ncbi:MAG: type II secretion system protein [Candidatus Cloacimonetes bacterium]|jgi:type II secretory pathway pseudopilin PulG|nr:type II secretion system GspH family protein [Candidatus Cloacimonadota bacterium]MDY0336827.1 type II secretion system protein [Candidatus Cloacimonadaceae bacterium]MCB5269330.1 type II secretion system GspH family protein [Candidatus Cloacimonadota bacterium]MDD2682928.1 type II secretion system protein [Candidatus Cloacimonadota bacterium]MDD3096990.1 type II secretion system protein [Candidatus Cloacimonadota bacterium]
MFRNLKNQRGITLIEVITVLLISTILIMVSGVAVSAFFRRYKVINDYLELQKEAMECLSTIRNGYPMNRGEQFYGVANADSMTITGSSGSWYAGSGIRIIPPRSTDYNRNDMVHFYLEDKAIKVKYTFNNIQVSAPEFLFPSRDMRDKIEVTHFYVSDGNHNGSILPLSEVSGTGLKIIKINMEARIKVKDAPLPNKVEYKTINYSTFMVKK